ncbi:acetate CoA-transferase subunit alpha [Ornithinibacillus sp. L9]|uniref:Acetate CoA-transferase subunit alpha n=1 Tax=Ornithinibacillus caprae TaxID=2678566 RepID=A0A6N8FH82_9BACI|nr:acetate CoA-transferase subunit alpha [Ornithinibacillus caprae]MUK88581.1 acetate CoA-transferase subunit alpha [Ornithinibacillus caprae]
MSKLITMKEAAELFKDNMTVMSGGFMGVGAPEKLVTAILDSNVQDITLISSDTALEDTGVGPLIANNRVKKVIASHIGTNPMTGKKMIAGELDVELVPQGTLAERVHAGGAGLGGVLTPTGVGTVVEEGKETLEIDGAKYLIEKPLRADIAILKAYKADKAGNLVFHQSARNFNPVMALAADLVIVEVEELVEIGDLDPDTVVTPGVLVDKVLA